MPAAPSEIRSNQRRGRVLRRVPAVVAGCLATVLIVISALAVLGTFLAGVPYLGLGAGVLPPNASRVVVLALIGAALVAYRWWRRRTRLTAALLVLTVLVLAGATTITARMTASFERAGADISLVDTLGLETMRPVGADAEETYTQFDGKPLKLSIYRPPAGSAAGRPSPVLLYVHGGGWIIGSRGERSTDMRWFADQGWLTISVDYPLSSEQRHLWNVTEDQLGCALAWVGRNAPRYGGDPARMSLTGDSSGGNLAADVGYRANSKKLTSSCGGAIPTVAAVSLMYPVMDPAGFYHNDDVWWGADARRCTAAYIGGSPEQFAGRYQTVTPARHLSAAAPPTLVIVGEADHLVPPEGAYRFAEQARERGVKIELVRVPYADHRFDTFYPGSIGQQGYRQLTADWLRNAG